MGIGTADVPMTATDSPSSPTATAEWAALRCSDDDDVDGVVVVSRGVSVSPTGVAPSAADMVPPAPTAAHHHHRPGTPGACPTVPTPRGRPPNRRAASVQDVGRGQPRGGPTRARRCAPPSGCLATPAAGRPFLSCHRPAGAPCRARPPASACRNPPPPRKADMGVPPPRRHARRAPVSGCAGQAWRQCPLQDEGVGRERRLEERPRGVGAPLKGAKVAVVSHLVESFHLHLSKSRWICSRIQLQSIAVNELMY